MLEVEAKLYGKYPSQRCKSWALESIFAEALGQIFVEGNATQLVWTLR